MTKNASKETAKAKNRLEGIQNAPSNGKAKSLRVQPIQPRNFTFSIIGTSPLIQHAWSEKALSQLRMTAIERKKQPKVARDPEAQAQACMYRTDDGKPGLPILAFKASLIAAAHKDLGIEKTIVRKALFVPCKDGNKCVPMVASEPICREDIVRVGMAQTDLRYRPEFREWSAEISVNYDAEMLSEQDIINLVNRAGFSVGIGEWRPEKGGEFGRFEFDTNKPAKGN